MKRKYLDDLGVTERPDTWNRNDKRQNVWKEERDTYGFDEREIWDLGYSFYCWLYERLMMYKENSCVVLSYHQFQYKGETLTQEECIDRMISGLKLVLCKEEGKLTKAEKELVEDIAYIWATVLPVMWC